MPKGRKRTQAEYEEEIEETAKRMRKNYPESLKHARDSESFREFLEGIGITTTETVSGSNFWDGVREKFPIVQRMSKYQEAREAGIPSKIARRMRDFGRDRFDRELENWLSKN